MVLKDMQNRESLQSYNKNFSQQRHLRYWGLTSEFQPKLKARHQFWAGPDTKTNQPNFKHPIPNSITSWADVTPPPSNSVNAGGVRRYCGGATVRWLLDIIINRGSSWKAEMPGELSLGGETSLLGRDDASQLTEVRSFSLNSHLLLTVFLYMTLCDFSRLQ